MTHYPVGMEWTLVAAYGINCRMGKTQKITTRVPAVSLRRAQAATGKGVVETVRIGFDLLA